MNNKISKYIGIFTREASDESELLLLFKKDYDNTNEFVRNLIYWNLRSDEVDDLVQMTYLKAWKAYPKFQQNSSFKTWIYRIAINTIRDHFRKLKPSEQYFDSAANQEKPELKDLITKAIHQLDQKHREVFVLYYKFSYTQAEISSTLNVPEGTIKTRLYKAKNVFSEFIKKNEGLYE